MDHDEKVAQLRIIRNKKRTGAQRCNAANSQPVSGATRPPRHHNIKYTVHIESPATAAEIDGLRQAVEATCPVDSLLKDGQAVKGSLVRGRYADKGAPPKS